MSRKRFAVRVLRTLDGETDAYYLADTSLVEYADCSGIAYTSELADAMTFRSMERAEKMAMKVREDDEEIAGWSVVEGLTVTERVLMLARRYADAMSDGSGGHVATRIGCFRVSLSGVGFDAHMSVWRTGMAGGVSDVRLFDVRRGNAITKPAGMRGKFDCATVVPLCDGASMRMLEALLTRFILTEAEGDCLIEMARPVWMRAMYARHTVATWSGTLRERVRYKVYKVAWKQEGHEE